MAAPRKEFPIVRLVMRVSLVIDPECRTAMARRKKTATLSK